MKWRDIVEWAFVLLIVVAALAFGVWVNHAVAESCRESGGLVVRGTNGTSCIERGAP